MLRQGLWLPEQHWGDPKLGQTILRCGRGFSTGGGGPSAGPGEKAAGRGGGGGQTGDVIGVCLIGTWTLKLPIQMGYHPIILGVKPIF